ncbi:squalene synthase HpnC [Undibacterium flavidum]|uniref:Squalene synthase HpnC n=1 Tax=Undibacterium flavidum TaxID=2762297 RepID=A0ABR6YDE2_9BURK|nr:squalene synthase HpnC [Undibacterium flavidum]MBC3874565.1 squalene synthase HpnC [Undibacterium flavidum]
MSVEHYENFPVASWLMPAHLRPAVKTIYAFARSADDIADEGDASDAQRLEALSHYEAQLSKIQEGAIQESTLDPLFRDLAKVIDEFQLPIAHFFDLISAFKQDIVCKQYADFAQLLDYCKRSANPVGRIMLHLYRANNAENLVLSDQICTALQLINFWQDVAIDWQKKRTYLPQEDLLRYQLDIAQIASGKYDAGWHAMMQFQIDRARSLMLAGSPLCKKLPGRFGFELRLVVQGGLRILEKIEQVNMDVFHQRPTIKSSDGLLLFWRAARM